MEEKKISIIVPIYNVEVYLNRCIDSIINQTYHNIEIILVDDGSPDNCGQICDSYAEQDQRIKVIHQQNQGLSGARNSGIEVAIGKYIAFVDSDDMIHPQYIEVLYKSCEQEKAQIGMCQFETVKEANSQPSKQVHLVEYGKISKDIQDGGSAIRQMYEEDYYIEYTVAWNKLYDACLFNEIRFPVGKIHEDEATTYKLLYIAKKVVRVEQKLYYYLIRENSITNSSFSLRRLDFLEALKDRIQFLAQYGEKELQAYSQCRYYYAMVLVWEEMSTVKAYNIQRRKLRWIIISYWPVVCRLPNVSVKKKCWMVFKGAFPLLASKLRKHAE
jgi:glycosyltransferase involved in cell wall biosynthesis